MAEILPYRQRSNKSPAYSPNSQPHTPTSPNPTNAPTKPKKKKKEKKNSRDPNFLGTEASVASVDRTQYLQIYQ